MRAPLKPELLRACRAMFSYHEATKHTPEKLRASRHFLDWDTMPDPFRRYDDVSVLDLPADPSPPGADGLEVLFGGSHSEPEGEIVRLLSQILFYSASISATKVSPAGSRYALRVNPSSGNLHPTEFHVLTRGIEGVADGVRHYQPAAHMLEHYGRGDFLSQLEVAAGRPMPARGLVVLLASILWREAWKYQSRAYRYCLHDIGHAWQAVALCGRALGMRMEAIGSFVDPQVKRLLGLDDEEPMLLLMVDLGEGGLVSNISPSGAQPELLNPRKNQLSPSQVRYPAIEEIHAATCMAAPSDQFVLASPRRDDSVATIPLDLPLSSCGESFAGVVRRRRSALDFEGGERSISREQFSTLLRAAAEPLDADFLGGQASPSLLLELWLYVHRVNGLTPGLYRYDMASQSLELRSGSDQQVMAAALSLQQELAGNACVAFSMLGDFAAAAEQFGNRGYRYLHFVAGAIGQKLYLAAHAMGFGATGIGAFFDDYVHAHLELQGQARQVIYHFACGYPVEDPRLSA